MFIENMLYILKGLCYNLFILVLSYFYILYHNIFSPFLCIDYNFIIYRFYTIDTRMG